MTTGTDLNLEAELDAPVMTEDSTEWREVLSLEVPELKLTHGCRVGIGMLSAKNADTRLSLYRGGARETITQTIVNDLVDDESFDTGEERELSGGERLVLEYRLGHQDQAEIARASIFVESFC